MRIELFVADPGASVAFYVDILGSTITGRDESSDYASLELEGSRVAIQGRRWLPSGHPLGRPGPPGLGVEIVLPVADVRSRYAAVLASAWPVTELVDQPWDLTDFRVQDPDGYYLRVASTRPA